MSSCFSFSLRLPFPSASPGNPVLDVEAIGGLVELERIVDVGMSRGSEEGCGEGCGDGCVGVGVDARKMTY